MREAAGRVAALEAIADHVEATLQEKPEREISTEEIGAYVMAELKQLDKVAFVRFASVYRNFRDLDEFKNELNELLRIEGMTRRTRGLRSLLATATGGLALMAADINVTPVVTEGGRVVASFSAPTSFTEDAHDAMQSGLLVTFTLHRRAAAAVDALVRSHAGRDDRGGDGQVRQPDGHLSGLEAPRRARGLVRAHGQGGRRARTG